MQLPTKLSSYTRVLKMASTPSFTEFSQIAKIAGAGILLVGAIGFVIAQIMAFFVTTFIETGGQGAQQALMLAPW
jgi:protein transport protein SEC61 subunit gamma-like protein